MKEFDQVALLDPKCMVSQRFTKLTNPPPPDTLKGGECTDDHEMARWLAEVLQPVLTQYSSNCVKDSFIF